VRERVCVWGGGGVHGSVSVRLCLWTFFSLHADAEPLSLSLSLSLSLCLSVCHSLARALSVSLSSLSVCSFWRVMFSLFSVARGDFGPLFFACNVVFIFFFPFDVLLSFFSARVSMSCSCFFLVSFFSHVFPSDALHYILAFLHGVYELLRSLGA
jgi:hypothetical protein